MVAERVTSAARRTTHRFTRGVARFGFERFVAAQVLLLACAAGFLAKVQSDTWWHLRTGQEMFRTGHVQLVDSYSHTAQGAYWPNYEWLSQLLFFSLYRPGGIETLAIVCGLLSAAACAMSFGLMRGGGEARGLVFLVAVLGAARAWAVRPQVISLTLVMATAWLVVTERRRWLPVVFIAWANLHGAVAWGVVLLVADVTSHALARDMPRLRASGGWAMLAIAATQATPLGLAYWPDILWSIRRSAPISEWQPPAFSAVFMPFWAMLVALGAAAVARRTAPLARQDTFLVIAAVLLGASAVRFERNISAFALVAAPALSRLLWRHTPAPGPPAAVTSVRGWAHAAVTAAMGSLAIAGVVWVWRERPDFVGSHPMSPAAAAAITNCPAPLYNHFNDGGFIIWFAPTQKVFLDSRQNPYPPDLVLAQVEAERTGNYDALLARYEPNCAVGRPGSQMATVFAAKGWHETFRDGQWVVLVRPDTSP